MQQNNFWCPHPFVSMQITGETATPCCVFKPKSPIPLDNYFENEEIIETRQQLLNGIAPYQCRECVESERKTGHSFRTQEIKFGEFNNASEFKLNSRSLKHVFLSSSNLCNLKCLPCLHGSYIRMVELSKLKLFDISPNLCSKDLSPITDLDFEKLTITGGEPFYDKNVFRLLEQLVELERSNFIALDINTNLTNISIDLLTFLVKNFKSVQLKGSIDGTGTTNNYLRYPSTWETIESAVDKILSIPEIEFCLTTALSNLSLLHFDRLLKWGVKKGIRNHYITPVSTPTVLSVDNLPISLKEQLITKYIDLNSTLDVNYYDRTTETINTCINVCNTKNNPDMQELVKFLTAHDLERNTDFRQVFPELQKIV